MKNKSKLKKKSQTLHASLIENTGIVIPRFGVINTKVVKSKKQYSRKNQKIEY